MKKREKNRLPVSENHLWFLTNPHFDLTKKRYQLSQRPNLQETETGFDFRQIQHYAVYFMQRVSTCVS